LAERLVIEGLRKTYGARAVLDGLSLRVVEGEILALLGASGCGKTTTLNLIAGLDRAEAGRIELNGQCVVDEKIFVPPHARGIGMVFQGQMLWPHMRVAEHLDFVLNAKGVAATERPARIAAQLEAVRLVGRDRALPSQLSGGEAQRLAIARALVARPALLLFDEPCANLDAPLKAELLDLLSRLRDEVKFSALYVTHDAAEAFEWATRVAVLDEGRLVQEGTAHELCTAPASPVVARLVGGGVLVEGVVVKPSGVRTALGVVQASGLDGASEGSRASVFFRTDDLLVDSEGVLNATVRSAHYDGRGWVVVVDADGTPVRARADQAAAHGEAVKLSVRRPPPAFMIS